MDSSYHIIRRYSHGNHYFMCEVSFYNGTVEIFKASGLFKTAAECFEFVKKVKEEGVGI